MILYKRMFQQSQYIILESPSVSVTWKANQRCYSIRENYTYITIRREQLKGCWKEAKPKGSMFININLLS